MRALKRFVPLDRNLHDRVSFDCGKVALNTFLSKQAAKHRRLNISSTHVLPAAGIPKGKPKPITAYYTLSIGEIHRESIPRGRKLPYYPIPVIVLARLAVDSRAQGQGLGEMTLIRAVRHSARIADSLPAHAIVVDVMDDQAMNFYRRYRDFQVLTDNPRRLFMPITIARQI